jgi:Fe-S-cluster containining protein
MRVKKSLEAGEFSSWSGELKAAIRGKNDSNVPCDGCVACCTSSQFIHVGPDEIDALSHIPKKLLFPAPRQPRGHFLLGYDQRGRCPMLIGKKCSIYEYRPRTCRTFDCRIFTAAGVVPEKGQALIARQVGRWCFSFNSKVGRKHHEAVRAAATFLREHSDKLLPEIAPKNATQLAVLAFRVHKAFLKKEKKTGQWVVVDSVSDADLSSELRQVR